MSVRLYGLPQVFLGIAAGEMVVMLATVRLLALARRNASEPVDQVLRLHVDRIAAAQLLHAVASGVFQVTMLFQPRLALSGVFGSYQPDPGTVQWARVMGALEIFMTWTYALSGVVGGLEPFVRLSVMTRLGALCVLVAGWAVGISDMSQVLGVFGDATLAVVTMAALATRNRVADKYVDGRQSERSLQWACAL
eukprot:m.240244 g.240244  ORF g.240244 m.240244 type:complete len:194 (-) comp50045_c0_seq1:50-631(-)